MQRENIAILLDQGIEDTASPVPLRLSGADKARRGESSASFVAILAEARRLISQQQIITPDISLTDEELLSVIATCALRIGVDLANFERDELLAQLLKEATSFGILQSLIENGDISDIIVHDFSKVVVQCGRSTHRTDISFSDQRSYESYVERILQRAGTTYSTKKPIADGMIGSDVRIHAVHACLCESGPYLTIRVNRLTRVNTEDLVRLGVAPRQVFDYLRKIVKQGLTVFVVGEVGTGKTTLVRALATAMPEKESILVIEDTPEIQLEHPHVRALTTRETNSEGAGRVSPSECIRAGMRMAMNRIIFGEIRDAEAAEAFVDVCASGHPGISTIHARSATEAITRLELFLGRAQRGTERMVIAEQIVTAVQVIIFINICPLTNKRRIMEVKEIGPVADRVIRQRDIFRYGVDGDRPQWRVVTRASAHREILERGDDRVSLSDLPASIELQAEARYPHYLIPLRGAANA